MALSNGDRISSQRLSDFAKKLWEKIKTTFVPTTRTINGKSLSSNVSLTGMDIPTVPGEAEETVYEYLQGTEQTYNKVSSWSSTTTDDNYPSEKLVKTTLDGKLDNSGNQTYAGMLSIKSQDASTNSQIRVMDPAGGTERINLTFNKDNQRGIYDSQLGSYIIYVENGATEPVLNGNALTASAAKSGSALETAINSKQNKLTSQTAYPSKGSATKVPQITTNSLGQVTSITEVTIDQPDISGKLNINGDQTFYGMLSIKSQNASTNSQIRVMDPVDGKARLNFQFNTSNKRGIYDSQLGDYVLFVNGTDKPVFNGNASSATKATNSDKWGGVSIKNTGGYTEIEFV